MVQEGFVTLKCEIQDSQQNESLLRPFCKLGGSTFPKKNILREKYVSNGRIINLLAEITLQFS